MMHHYWRVTHRRIVFPSNVVSKLGAHGARLAVCTAGRRSEANSKLASRLCVAKALFGPPQAARPRWSLATSISLRRGRGKNFSLTSALIGPIDSPSCSSKLHCHSNVRETGHSYKCSVQGQLSDIQLSVQVRAQSLQISKHCGVLAEPISKTTNFDLCRTLAQSDHDRERLPSDLVLALLFASHYPATRAAFWQYFRVALGSLGLGTSFPGVRADGCRPSPLAAS